MVSLVYILIDISTKYRSIILPNNENIYDNTVIKIFQPKKPTRSKEAFLPFASLIPSINPFDGIRYPIDGYNRRISIYISTPYGYRNRYRHRMYYYRHLSPPVTDGYRRNVALRRGRLACGQGVIPFVLRFIFISG